MKSPRFPHKLHVGSVCVTIYREKRKGGYTTYLLRWKQGGEVMKEAKNDLQEALRRGNEVATLISEGRAEMTDVTVLQRERYADLEKLIKHTGLTLTQVVEKFVESWEPELIELPMATVLEEYIASKEGKSERYLEDIKQKVGSFSKKFGKRILSTIKKKEYTDFIESKSKNPRTRFNYLTHLKSFLIYSKQKGYISKKLEHPLVDVEYKFNGESDDKLIPASDLLKLFEAITRREDESDNLLTLGIQAFTGMRVAEFRRLTWEDIHFDGGVLISIAVNRHKAKTKTRRSITASDELKALFARVEKKTSGPLTRYDKPDRVIQKIAKKIGVVWPKNGLRHTFITHELSRVKDVAQVAYFAGNSEDMIYNRYNGLSVPSETRAWFNVAFNLPPPFSLRQRYQELQGTPPMAAGADDVNRYDDLPHGVEPQEGQTS
jgi:integrase